MKENLTKNVTVFGAGSWGTALAIHLARKGYCVKLYGNQQDSLAAMQETRENARYLPGIKFPDSLTVCGDWQRAQFEEGEDVLLAVPSVAFRKVLTHLKFRLPDSSRIIWGTKGLDTHSHDFLHKAAKEILGEDRELAVLSGPSFAKEVANEMPTAVVIASEREETATYFSELFMSPCFKTYISTDMIGVQLSGAMKNIIAIGVGISDGLGFGANSRSALITRGLAEITKLGMCLGAVEETFLGLAGVGDLVLTCTDNQSRNRRLGLALGQGDSKEQARSDIAQSVEGMEAAVQIQKLASKCDLEMPIVECVYYILHHDLSPKEAVQKLLARETKYEF